MDNQEYLNKIKEMREGETIKRDPELIGYIVRDWDVTADAGLRDLCWAMCQDSCVHTNDAIFLLNQLEAHLTKRAADLRQTRRSKSKKVSGASR